MNRTLCTFARACYASRNSAAAREAMAAAMLAADVVAVPYLDALYVLRGSDVLCYPFDPDASRIEVTTTELAEGRKRLRELRTREDEALERQAAADAIFAAVEGAVVADAASYVVPFDDAPPLTKADILPLLGPPPRGEG